LLQPGDPLPTFDEAANAVLFGLRFLLPGGDPISELGCNGVTKLRKGFDGERMKASLKPIKAAERVLKDGCS